MNLKPVVSIIGGILVILCGEALKLGYTDWIQFMAPAYWLGVGTQIGGLLLAIGGGVAYKIGTGQSVDLTKVGKLVLPMALALALGSAGCAGRHGYETAVKLAPIIAEQIQGVQTAVELQKPGLVAADCTTDSAKPRNCYIAAQATLEQVATYHTAFADALAAMNTTSAREAVARAAGLVSAWIQTDLLKLPEKIRVWVLIGLESLRGSLLAASVSLGG